ncbi:hypothetical protein GNF85_20090 [Clostridium perfringens]
MDFAKFAKMMDKAGEAVQDGAVNGVEDALEYWQLKATNLAPIGRYKGRRGGNLRARIDHTTPKVGPDGITGSVVANAFNNGFNYAYYLHSTCGSSFRTATDAGKPNEEPC